jgi:uncharacterized protein (TIGR02646 family)
MRHINKREEPQSFVDWKKKFKNKYGRFPGYNDLKGQPKEELKESLFSEQGYICCYCCKRIGASDSHIEHLRPKGDTKYQKISLEYENLFASCQGYSGDGENCGHRKGNKYDENLFVSPLDECEDKFMFTIRGRIRPVDDDERASYTINLLQLDTPQLNAAREAAIWASGAMEDLTDEERTELIQVYQNRDENGNYAEFSDAIMYMLKSGQA